MERHGFDGLSFIFGTALVVLGALLVAGVGEVVVTGFWIGPLTAILIGVALLLAAPRQPRKDPDAGAEEAA